MTSKNKDDFMRRERKTNDGIIFGKRNQDYGKELNPLKSKMIPFVKETRQLSF